MRITEGEKPIPGAGECLVEVKAVSICGSDIHIFSEGNVGGVTWDRPFSPCHEFAGICRGGRHIPDGTTVVVEPALPCGRCDMCHRAWHHLCRNLEFCGLPPRQGALREFVPWPESALFRAPLGLDFAAVALLEPLAVAVHAVELVPPPPGARVAVLGCGGIGLCILQVARAAGAKDVLATDLIPERLELARRLGADATALADREDPVAVALDWSHGEGCDVVYEAAGAPETPDQAVRMLRPFGQVALLGIPVEDVMTMGASVGRRHEVTIQWIRRQNHNQAQAIRLVEQGLVDLAPLATHRFPLKQAQQAFELAESKADGSLRVVIEP
ncbi:MAG: zinc-binding dehydrogenase [Armatimonadota bacterium]|nr:MAG: zinc-binding dehydrogenase [Armatimonadota bacterium]